jgi:hypothetical protein
VIGFCVSRGRPMNDVARHTKGGFRPSSAINENGPSAKALAALVRIYMEGAPSRLNRAFCSSLSKL